jgi:hypothetical protein
MKTRTRISMVAAVLVVATVVSSSPFAYGAGKEKGTKFDLKKHNKPPHYGFDTQSKFFKQWNKSAKGKVLERFPLYPGDNAFKARWAKVRDIYPKGRGARKKMTPEQIEQSRKDIESAWKTGCILSRVLLTDQLLYLEGRGRGDTPATRNLMQIVKTFDQMFPGLTEDIKYRILGEVATWRLTHRGPGGKWGTVKSYVVTMDDLSKFPACVEPTGKRPFMWTSRKDLPALKARLKKEPWKTWYALVVKISDSCMAGKNGSEDEELRLRFPAAPGRSGHLPYAAECCALRYYVEGKKAYGLKAKELLNVNFGNCNIPGIVAFTYGIKGSGWTAWEECTYDLTADLYSPEEKLKIEKYFYLRSQKYSANYNFNMTWFRQAVSGCSAILIGNRKKADYLAGEIRKYVGGLRGEGENFEYWAYKSHVYENLIGPFACAYKNVYGKDLFGPILPKYASALQHYVRVASPLGTMPEFGDCQLMQSFSGYHVWALNSLPDPARGELMWHWLRSGDPRFVHVRAGDRKRLTGGKFPVYTSGWLPMDDQYDTTKRERRYPVGEAKLVRAILTFRDPMPKPIKPPTGSYIAPKSGVVCLRTGLEPDDLQITTHTKRVGSIGFHGERDTMSILMYAYGSPLLVHPGYHDIPGHYAKPEKMVVKTPPAPCTKWVGNNGNPLSYQGSVYSRSLVAIGNDGGWSGGGAGYWMKHSKAKDMPVEVMISNSGDGYFKGSDPKGHFRRAILMVKPEKIEKGKPKGYFVLVDDVLTTKTDAKSKWLLQTRGEKVQGDDNTRTWTSYDYISIPPKPVRLLVHWVRPKESKVTMKMGIWSPYPDKYGDERPFPQIDWKGPGRVITVLYPLADGMKAPKIVDLPPSTGSGQAGKRGVKVGADTIEADAQKVVFTRGGKSFAVSLKSKD